jgi:Lar family restriction alleviation protein
MSSLKPCPFCGRKASILTQWLKVCDGFFVKCDSCAVTMTGQGSTERGAIDAWNQRAPTQGADARPVATFDDPRVQGVYELLCEPANPPAGEHWEGFIARKIVDLLATRDAAPSDAQDAERAAKALERKRCEQYEWTDDEFEIWWDKDDRCKRDERIAEAQFILDAASAPMEKT